MKNTIQLALIAGITLILSACGGDSNQNNNNATNCQAGQVYTTTYGCQQQGTVQCPAGQVSTANYGCVVSTGTTTGVNNCQSGYVSTQQYGCALQGTYSCTNGQVSTQQYGCVAASTTYNNGNTCQAGYISTQQYGCALQGTFACSNGQVSTQQYGCVTPGTTTYNGGYNNGYGTPTAPINGVCQPGTYLTQYGCLSQGPCYSGQVYYNNQCYRLIQPGYGTAGFQWHYSF